MDDISHRGFNKQAKIIWNIVILSEEFNLKRSYLDFGPLSLLLNIKLGLIGKIFLSFQNYPFG